jgi:hypothetical protein
MTEMLIDTDATATKTTLGIAYHNVAAEYEFLGRFDLATKFYDKGYVHCLNELGEDHDLTINLFNNM